MLWNSYVAVGVFKPKHICVADSVEMNFIKLLAAEGTSVDASVLQELVVRLQDLQGD